MNLPWEIMYTKESTCGGFLETGDRFIISDKRNEDVSRAFAYDIDRTANVIDLRSDRNNHPVKVSTATNEVTLSNQYLSAVADVDCERHRKRYRQDLRYVHVPNYPALPTRCNSEHVQLAKRRKLQEETAGQSDTGQMYNEPKRMKFIENLDVRERNSDETKFEAFLKVTSSALQKTEPWKRFPDAADVWNSTGSEGEQTRDRFFRPVQPALHLKSSSEACPEDKERPVRTSSRVNLPGGCLAKENFVALDNASMARLPQQPNSDLIMNSEYFKMLSNRKFISDEYSSQLIDSTASPFTTTSYLHQSFQPCHRSSYDRLKSENFYHLRDSISSSVEPQMVNVSTGGATFRKDFPRVEIPDLRLAFRAQSESWCHKRGSAENDKTWSAGMPLHHSEDPRRTSWSVAGQEQIESPKFAVLPSNMEEIKENVLTDSMPCYRNRYFGENRSVGLYRLCQESQIVKGEEKLTGGEWRTLEKPWQQGLSESSLGKVEHDSAGYVFGNVLDRGPTKYSHLERPSHTANRVVSNASRYQFSGSDVYARDETSPTREMSKNNDRSDNVFTDTPSSRRWTSPDYSDRTFHNVRHVYARQTMLRAKSLSPSLMSNVGSGSFGSLESIRAFYRTMGRLTKSSSSSSNSKSVSSSSSRSCIDESSSSSSSQYPETGTNGPIDLSRRVQLREHCDIAQNELTNNARCSAHVLTSDKQSPGDEIPNTGSSVDVENYRKRYTLSVSLPSSRISSPSPDSHLPPKKRRYLSYEWVTTTSESRPAGEGNDGGMWAEDGVVKSTGRASIVDDENLSR